MGRRPDRGTVEAMTTDAAVDRAALETLSYDELRARAEQLYEGYDYDDPDQAVDAELAVLCELIADRQPWTLFVSCTGDPVLVVEANSAVAETVASALGIDLGRRCGQCGDVDVREVELADSTRPEVDCRVVPADEIDALLAGT